MDGNLYTAVTSSYPVVPASEEYLRYWSKLWNIPFFGGLQQPQIDTILPEMRPAEIHRIPGDGDCLFTSFARIVSGSNCVASGAMRPQDLMRDLLCGFIHSVPLSNHQFLLYSDGRAHNASSYLETSNMRTRGVWGGDIEIQSFCSVFQLKVALFLSQPRQWVVMEPLLRHSRDELPAVFLIFSSNHFEAITRLCLPGNQHPAFSNSEILKRGDRVSFPTHITRHHILDTNFGNIFSHDNEEDTNSQEDITTLEEDRILSEEVCDSCSRVSTLRYPFVLRVAKCDELKKRNFGPRQKANELQLCTLCWEFLQNDTKLDDRLWDVAWACVLKRTMVNDDYWWILPAELKLSWSQYFTPREDPKMSLVLDITHEVKNFKNLIQSYESKNFVAALEIYSQPKVRCFCGASEFIYDCGVVPFNHLLNYMFPCFSHFSSNWRKFLAPIREDFLIVCDENLPFVLRPCLISNNSGLMLATCKRHNGGCSRQMVHVPRHPVCSNLSHPFDNRLAPLTPSLRAATTMRVGAFSKTWTISKSSGGFNGVGAISLSSSFRPLAVKSQLLLPGKEYIFLRKRQDMFENLSRIADEYHLDSAFIEDLKCSDWDIPANYEDFLVGSSYISLATTVSLKKLVDESIDDAAVVPPVLQNTMKQLSRKLLLPKKNIFLSCYGCAMFWIAVRNIDSFNCLLTLLSPTPMRSNIVTFLLKGTLSSCWQMCDCLVLPASISLGDLLMSVFGSSKNFLFVSVEDQLRSDIAGFEGQVVCLQTSTRSAANYEPELRQLGFDCVLMEYNAKRNPEFSIAIKPCSHDSAFVCLNRKTLKQTVCDSVDWKGVQYAVFIRRQKAPVSACRYVSGQNKFQCPDHNLFLSVDFQGSGYNCVAIKCRRKSKWRCPEENCPFSLCQTHLSSCGGNDSCYQIDKNVHKIPKLEDSSDGDSDDSKVSNDEQCENFIADALLFEPPIPTTDILSSHADTDAGVMASPIELSNPSDDLKSIPIQAFFNTFLAVMNRPRNPVDNSNRFKRFLQTLTSKLPMCSVSLLQPEALLFPAIFYHQMEDGSFPGALPNFLYTLTANCTRLGFEDLMQHFVTRITDISLLTSSSIPYIQYAVDCLINCSLGRQHSQAFFRKGLQSLELRGRESSMFYRSVNVQLNDSERCVGELSAAVATEPPTLFLTLTCNQKCFPGMSSLMSQLNNKYKDCTDEVRRASVDSVMTTAVRAWSNCVGFLVEHLLKSKENILGKVIKLWGRAEFQTTVGNLPHYHILLWSEITETDLDDIIQCAHKHIRYALNGVMKSTMGLINDQKHLDELFDLCIKIHTHRCEMSNYRCLKRIDEDGNKVCRTPPYPVSNCHWKLPIQVIYPEDALTIMAKIGMATEVNEKIPGWLVPDGVMKCEKWMYGASQG